MKGASEIIGIFCAIIIIGAVGFLMPLALIGLLNGLGLGIAYTLKSWLCAAFLLVLVRVVSEIGDFE